MIVEQNLNGSYVVSALIDGYLVTKTYYGYSREESIESYKDEYGEED